MVRIQYASGLARALKENRGRYCDLLNPVAPYVALCGNIVSPHNKKVAEPFLDWLSTTYEKVWWVPGREEVAAFNVYPKKGAGVFPQGVTDNLAAMYEIIKNGPHSNIYIANKLAKTYVEGFTIIGISQPSFKETNINGVFHSTGVPYTLSNLSDIYDRDKAWIEKELAVLGAQKRAGMAAKNDPVFVLTNGYLQTDYFYSANLVGDIARNFTGYNSFQHEKAWVGSNNWEAEGYDAGKFIEFA